MDKGIIFCIAGPSGSGKTTLSNNITEISFGSVSRIVTVTTRPPRESEADGEDYHFWSNDRFARGVADDMFFEHENIHGHRYGTLNGSLEEIIESKKISIIILDVNGAIRLKNTFPNDSVTIFLTCKTKSELKDRIIQRKSTAHDINNRLNSAHSEIEVYNKNAHSFDYLIINETLSSSIHAFSNIIAHETVRRGRRFKLGE
jgi:guanylate kinase